MKSRAIISRFVLDGDDKKLLQRYARNGGHGGLRAILRQQGMNALIAAKDWEREQERAGRVTKEPKP